MKKILSLILALLMSASCASMAFADDDAATTDAPADEPVEDAAEEESVEDVEEDLGAYELAVKFLASTGEKNEDGTVDGIMKGKGDKFDVDANVKRYEMALFAARISTGWVKDSDWKGLEAATDFTDLEGSGAINVLGALTYVSQKGIIEGYGDGTFKPEQSVTYREALTMAVRTLGYTNLGYPWGYIEKAVKLGLTNGIEGIAYTDEATRGVAAQIIYNTLFAEEGRLALASFGVSYGWTNIMITSSIVDKYNEANYDKVDYNTPADHVAFQVINDNGTLDDKVYYVKADNAQLNLGTSAEHADELALGVPYKALFSIDADDEYVDLIYAEAYAVTASVANTGRTDDTGAAYVDNVSVAIKDHKLVEKYAASDLLSSSNKAYNATKSCIVKAPTEVKVATGTVDPEYKLYAFDFANGNILKWNEDNNEYEVAWYYSEFGGCYFNVKDDNWGDKGAGIDILDDADLAAIKAEIYEASIYYTANWIYDDATPAADKLYNSIDLYDFDGDGDYEYALYLDNYIFGILADKDKACDHGTGISIKDGEAEKVFMSACDKCKRDGYWLGEDSIEIEDAKGEYVIATYNEVTKELNIIKKTEEKTDDRVDVDTYYAKGVLEGYSASGEYVIIDGEKYAFNNDFGNFTKASGDTALLKYTDKFAELYMNYVTYYVLDGGIIAITPVAAGTNNWIVVEDYAGYSKDGYVTVYGYNTASENGLALDEYRIAVFDQWADGSLFWYPTAEKAAEYFANGKIYNVLSYDEDKDIYYVEVLDELKKDTKTTIEIKSGYRVTDGATPVKVADTDMYIIIGQGRDGYMPIAAFKGKAADGWKINGYAMVAANGTYVFTDATVVGFNYDAWANAGLVMVLNKNAYNQFFNGADDLADLGALQGANQTSGILVYNFYTGNFAYQAKATNLKVAVGEIYRTINDKLMSEVELDYEALKNIMAETYSDGNFVDNFNAVDNIDTVDYLFRTVILDSDWFHDGKTADDIKNAKNAFSKDIVSQLFGINVGEDTYVGVDGLVNSIAINLVSDTDKDGFIDKVETYEEATFDAAVKLPDDYDEGSYKKVYGWAVMKLAANGTVDVVIYTDGVVDADVTDTDVAVVPTDYSMPSTNVIGMLPEAESYGYFAEVEEEEEIVYEAGIQAIVHGTKTTTTTTVNNAVTDVDYEHVVNGITITWVGDSPELDAHATIRENGYMFGYEALCIDYTWTLKDDNALVRPGQITFETYGNAGDHSPDLGALLNSVGDALCCMIKSFTFDFATPITLDGDETVTKVITLNEGTGMLNEGTGMDASIIDGLFGRHAREYQFVIELSIGANGDLVVTFVQYDTGLEDFADPMYDTGIFCPDRYFLNSATIAELLELELEGLTINEHRHDYWGTMELDGYTIEGDGFYPVAYEEECDYDSSWMTPPGSDYCGTKLLSADSVIEFYEEVPGYYAELVPAADIVD